MREKNFLDCMSKVNVMEHGEMFHVTLGQYKKDKGSFYDPLDKKWKNEKKGKGKFNVFYETIFYNGNFLFELFFYVLTFRKVRLVFAV